ncbi:thymidylate synthase [Gammaproteobacteria bacterium]|nr:thymidylate synthase [Gammaproteobacteria bacterium]
MAPGHTIENQYLALLDNVLNNGALRNNRTKTKTYSIFSAELRGPIAPFPLLTTKKVAFKAMLHELLWFISGETNIAYLKKNKVQIWDEWADENGDLGPVYGEQWRKWQGCDGKIHDQLSMLIENIKSDPFSRRHIINAWNVALLDKMALPPCHLLFQFYVTNDRKLNCKLFQRSADLFLGVPFNIASYSVLTMMIASVCDLEPGEFVWSGTDVHIYQDHIDAVRQQLSHSPLPPPRLEIEPQMSIDEFKFEHFKLHQYQHHGQIKAPVAV